MSIRNRIPEDNPVLLEIWLRAVRATHAFLREQDVEDLYLQVRDRYLPSVTAWVWEDLDGCIAGFIGMHKAQVEMLFVDPNRFGQCIGTRLLDHTRKQYANLTVDVNEQNLQAHAFYRRYGFKDVGRSTTDFAGRPFPLVHMALKI
ncbi:GNAT family N-acetyltransferase [Caballeronia sp. 15711]|uniref:GNAT family N-acetyltransferase n=1 Tax=Caballeronia sp. 15711 TaxID=3391029 RepID=UPI0039E311A4